MSEIVSETMEEPTANPENKQLSEAEVTQIKAALHDLFSKIFTKSYMESDEYVQAHTSGSQSIPLDAFMQAPQILELTSDSDLIRFTLMESKIIYIHEDDTVRPIVKPEQNTLILRDIPSSTSSDEIVGIFTRAAAAASATQDGISFTPAGIRSDMNDTWFITFSSEASARAALSAIQNVKFNDRRISARLKTTAPVKPIYTARGDGARMSPEQNGQQQGPSPGGVPSPTGQQGMYMPPRGPHDFFGGPMSPEFASPLGIMGPPMFFPGYPVPPPMAGGYPMGPPMAGGPGIPMVYPPMMMGQGGKMQWPSGHPGMMGGHMMQGPMGQGPQGRGMKGRQRMQQSPYPNNPQWNNGGSQRFNNSNGPRNNNHDGFNSGNNRQAPGGQYDRKTRKDGEMGADLRSPASQDEGDVDRNGGNIRRDHVRGSPKNDNREPRPDRGGRRVEPMDIRDDADQFDEPRRAPGPGRHPMDPNAAMGGITNKNYRASRDKDGEMTLQSSSYDPNDGESGANDRRSTQKKSSNGSKGESSSKPESGEYSGITKNDSKREGGKSGGPAGTSKSKTSKEPKAPKKPSQPDFDLSADFPTLVDGEPSPPASTIAAASKAPLGYAAALRRGPEEPSAVAAASPTPEIASAAPEEDKIKRKSKGNADKHSASSHPASKTVPVAAHAPQDKLSDKNSNDYDTSASSTYIEEEPMLTFGAFGPVSVSIPSKLALPVATSGSAWNRPSSNDASPPVSAPPAPSPVPAPAPAVQSVAVEIIAAKMEAATVDAKPKQENAAPVTEKSASAGVWGNAKRSFSEVVRTAK